MATPPNTTSKRPQFFTGDRVSVRSASEILATLGPDGCLDGVPFMPEMTAMIGQTLAVDRRADRTCVEGFGLRKFDDVVFLTETRCNASHHDGCQRNCLLFWKEAWLQPASDVMRLEDTADEQAARAALLGLPTRQDGGYLCQSTQLHRATAPLSKQHLPELLQGTARGDISPAGFLRIVVRAAINRLRAAAGRPELGLIVGAAGKKSKGALGLKPGDWVRIKPAEAIRASLGPNAKNLGLSFEPEMAMSIGKVRQVDAVIERMIHEETGQMVALTRTVSLKGVFCEGLCSKSCPRRNPLFWREAWLERVDAPH